MKKMMMVAILLIASVFSFGQITVLTEKKVGRISDGVNEALVLKMSGEFITLDYRTFDQFKGFENESIRFAGGEKELKTFYEAIQSVFDSEDRKYRVELNLGQNQILTIRKSKIGNYINIGNGRSFTNPLTRGQIDKLFGFNN